jgi:hypothetical protein
MNNGSFFSIPIDVPGGTGPILDDSERWGVTRSADLDTKTSIISLIKDTSFGHPGKNKFGIVRFRAEFLNIFNVNFALPSNVVLGSASGIISKTAGTARQIQFSLKVIH